MRLHVGERVEAWCRAAPRALVAALQRLQVQSPNASLTGVRAPVSTEHFTKELQVTGQVPPELAGLYLRTGPNPAGEPASGHHWCAPATYLRHMCWTLVYHALRSL
jgi:hypothetical protein